MMDLKDVTWFMVTKQQEWIEVETHFFLLSLSSISRAVERDRQINKLIYIYTTWDGVRNRSILGGVLGNSSLSPLLFECCFHLNQNLQLFLQGLPSFHELHLLCFEELVHFVELVVQACKEFFCSISISKLLKQLSLIHVSLTCRWSRFLMNLQRGDHISNMMIDLTINKQIVKRERNNTWIAPWFLCWWCPNKEKFLMEEKRVLFCCLVMVVLVGVLSLLRRWIFLRSFFSSQ